MGFRLYSVHYEPPTKDPSRSNPLLQRRTGLHRHNRGPALAEWPGLPEVRQNEHYYLATQKRWKCKACKKQFSVKVGTIFEDSPISLDKWLMALWMLVNCKNGISSYEVGRDLGITQKSAWFVLHRLRLALQNGSMEKLGGHGSTSKWTKPSSAARLASCTKSVATNDYGTRREGQDRRDGHSRTRRQSPRDCRFPIAASITSQAEIRSSRQSRSAIYTDALLPTTV